MGGIVVIAGGSGLVGEALCTQLTSEGYTPRLLSRSAGNKNGITAYRWDPAKGEIDIRVFEGAEYVINLAGENVGKGRWTDKRKQQLTDSRLQSTGLLVKTINAYSFPVKKFIQASAVGYYGFGDSSVTFTETDGAGDDFLARLCRDWESSLQPLAPSIPKVIIRIGVVFSPKGGAFTAMAKPVKYMLGAPIGNGNQIIPWIHIDDLVTIFSWALRQPGVEGIYNAASPHPLSHKQLVKEIAAIYKRPVWPVGIPSILLRLMLGEQAQIVLKGNKVSVDKLVRGGFNFRFPHIREALGDLIK